MALIVLLRGINVGGYRALRPSLLAEKLGAYDVVNVGAAGTFVVRKPGRRAQFLAELQRQLPLDPVLALCDARDLIRLEMDNPFRDERPCPDLVQFVSILPKAGLSKLSFPAAIPEDGEWFVRIMGARGQFVFGVYRRHIKTIRYLGRIDDIFGAPATTRSWKTMVAVLRVLQSSCS